MAQPSQSASLRLHCAVMGVRLRGCPYPRRIKVDLHNLDPHKLPDRLISSGLDIVRVIMPYRAYRGIGDKPPKDLPIPDDKVQDILDEGRRHFDRQLDSLDRLRLRGQFAFTAAVVFLGFLAAKFSAVRHHGSWIWLWYILALALLSIGLAGAASPILARIPFASINLKDIATPEMGSKKYLAVHYLRISKRLESVVLRLLWTLRYAMRCLIYGTIFGCITLAIVYG